MYPTWKAINKPKNQKHRPATWCNMAGVFIYDPDGWRMDKKNFLAPITKKEFIQRLSFSTTTTLDLKKYKLFSNRKNWK